MDQIDPFVDSQRHQVLAVCVRGVGVLYLWGIRVVEHTEDHPGHGVLGVGHVPRGSEGGQVVLQRLAEHAVEGNVRAQDVALLPAVLLQLLDLGP